MLTFIELPYTRVINNVRPSSVDVARSDEWCHSHRRFY